MDGRYLLDTNIIIAALASDPTVLNQIDDADHCFVSTTVLGEMIYGALNSSDPQGNLDRLRSFTEGRGFLACDDHTANIYGDVKTALRKAGKPIPDNDIWIAASAIQHSLTLATRDAHFDEITNVNKTRW